MAEIAADGIGTTERAAGLRTVVAASAPLGATFEWYDFFVFGSLTQVISTTFFSGLNETAGYVAALALFGVGFAFRPVSGRLGVRTDRRSGGPQGRLPDHRGPDGGRHRRHRPAAQPTRPPGSRPRSSLLAMRVVQGFPRSVANMAARRSMSASTPVRPPVAAPRAGVQTAAAFGLFAALLVIFLTRLVLAKSVGPDWPSSAWGWRIPFLVSAGLLAVSIFMRMKLAESPTFAAMKEKGDLSAAPYAEAFGQWKNLKLVLLALVAVMFAQGAVWYTAFFYAQTFMEKFLKVDPATINGLMMAVVAASAPCYVFFGWLSDKWGRKAVMLFGMTLMLAAYFPGFHLLTNTLNPALAEATAASPATVIADPVDCSLQFDPVGKASFTSSCDIAKSALANAGVSYVNQAGQAGQLAMVRVGLATIPSLDARGLPKDVAKAIKTSVEGKIKEGLARAGYPAKADPKRENLPGAFGVMMIFVIASTALFGPIAAFLVELFPTRIRYTSLSLPYHIGTGWVGGFVPFTAFAIVASVGNIYSGLWYPFAFTAIACVTCLFLVPETVGRPLDS